MNKFLLTLIVICAVFLTTAVVFLIFSERDDISDNVTIVGEPPSRESLPRAPEPLEPEPESNVGADSISAHEPEPEPEPAGEPPLEEPPAAEPEPITLATFIPAPERSAEIHALTTQRAEVSLGAEYFDNSMIIGDSIITGFSIWRDHIKINGETLENTVIFANGSYGIYNALQEVSSHSIHPRVNDVQMRPEDAVAAYGAERVFIAMGLNDIYLPLDSFLHNYALLLNRILDKNPDVQVIILPVPPYVHEAQPSPDRNARIAEYNNALIVLAHELGISFIDSTAPLRDENGGLKLEFCGDPPPSGQGCHWVPSAYGEVLKFIAEHPA